MKRALVWAPIAATALMMGLATPLVDAADPTSIQITAKPVAGTPLAQSGGHEVVLLPLSAGQRSTQTLHLVNTTDKTAAVVVRGVDGFTDTATGFGFTSVDKSPSADGNWITVSTPQLTLGPGEGRDVSFTVVVPEGVRTGEHLAGVAVYSPVTQASQTINQGNVSVQMIIQPQRVVGVQVNVPGEAVPAMAVSGARPVSTDAGIAIALTLANQGTAIAHGSGVLTVPSTGLRTQFPITAFVPGTGVDLQIPWTKSITAGQHDVAVQLFFDGNRTVNWSGTIDVSGTLLSKLQSDVATRSLAGTPAHRSWLSANLLWLSVAAAIVIIALAFVARPRRPRRVPVFVAAPSDR
jgi:hypothetical protein